MPLPVKPVNYKQNLLTSVLGLSVKSKTTWAGIFSMITLLATWNAGKKQGLIYLERSNNHETKSRWNAQQS